jgi:hypothetical protein
MMERLPTRLWVEALIRRAEVAGASGFIVQHGDDSPRRRAGEGRAAGRNGGGLHPRPWVWMVTASS